MPGPERVTQLYSDWIKEELKQHPDALVLMLRAIREGYRVLAAHAIPVTPATSTRSFCKLPHPCLIASTSTCTT